MQNTNEIREGWKEKGINPAFYKCDRPKLKMDEYGWILEQFDQFMGDRGPKPPGDIDALEIALDTDYQKEQYAKLCTLFGHDYNDGFKFDLVFCSWASLHTDPTFKGTMFASLVLRTGFHPYVVCAHEVGLNNEGLVGIHTSALSLGVGDLFVIDPMIPHCANPAFPADDSYLVLLQSAEAFKFEKDQSRFCERFAPAKGHRYDGFD